MRASRRVREMRRQTRPSARHSLKPVASPPSPQHRLHHQHCHHHHRHPHLHRSYPHHSCPHRSSLPHHCHSHRHLHLRRHLRHRLLLPSTPRRRSSSSSSSPWSSASPALPSLRRFCPPYQWHGGWRRHPHQPTVAPALQHTVEKRQVRKRVARRVRSFSLRGGLARVLVTVDKPPPPRDPLGGTSYPRTFYAPTHSRSRLLSFRFVPVFRGL